MSALYLNLFPKCRHGHFLLFFCGLHFMSRSFSSAGLRRRTIRDTESPYFRGWARSSDWFRHRSDSVCLHPAEHHVPLPWGGGHVPELRPQILYRGPQKRHEPEKSKEASCLLTTFCTFLTISCLFWTISQSSLRVISELLLCNGSSNLFLLAVTSSCKCFAPSLFSPSLLYGVHFFAHIVFHYNCLRPLITIHSFYWNSCLDRFNLLMMFLSLLYSPLSHLFLSGEFA